jgi:hypothetical protein
LKAADAETVGGLSASALPDMMNIYNGVATLDANGEALIQMPEWFGR